MKKAGAQQGAKQPGQGVKATMDVHVHSRTLKPAVLSSLVAARLAVCVCVLLLLLLLASWFECWGLIIVQESEGSRV